MNNVSVSLQSNRPGSLYLTFSRKEPSVRTQNGVVDFTNEPGLEGNDYPQCREPTIPVENPSPNLLTVEKEV